MINVVVSEPFVDLVDPAVITAAAEAVLRHPAEVIDGDLSVVIEDDAYLHQLNLDFLGIDAPTDVLSFPSGEDEVDPETQRPYLGDIILSYPRAVEQAAAAGHSPLDEIQLLIVHGTLHLLGHDHAGAEEKTRMWAAQSAILSSLGVQIKKLPE